MTIYVCNAFSLNMLDSTRVLSFVSVPQKLVVDHLSANDETVVNAMGHPDVERVAKIALGDYLPNKTEDRPNVKFKDGDTIFVLQYTGARLPEGTTVLPEGANLNWWEIY